MDQDVAFIEVRLDGTQAVIDRTDVPLIDGIKWQFTKDGVRSSPRAGERSRLLHRVILSLPPGNRARVDHINGDVLDNRRRNLRIADAAQNGWNRTRPNKNNTSGSPGVSRNRKGWVAYIDIRRKRYYLGTFPTIERAAEARRAAELRYFGEWAPHDVTSQKSPVRGTAGADEPIV